MPKNDNNSILDGNNRFVQGSFESQSDRYRELLAGQSPRALYIGCADSRVVPNFILDLGPGELFVVRTIGGIVPLADDPASATVGAALDYALDVLGVPNVIVCGHDRCGALEAILSGTAPRGGHLDRWLRRGGVDASGREGGGFVEKFVRHQVDKLSAYPSVVRALGDGRLTIHGWVYDPATGRVRALDASGAFVVREDDVPGRMSA